jgi:hypothetical protein
LKAPKERKVLVAEKFVTLDPTDTEASWIVIEGDRIAEVGGGDPPEDLEAVHLNGVALPGFIDAHVHLTPTGLYQSGLDLREARSVSELLASLEERARKHPEGEWLIAGNFDPGRNADDKMPTRHELDSATRGAKVMLSRTDGHSCSLSSAALDAIQIKDGLEGVDRGDDGSPTGVVRNQANYSVRSQVFSTLSADEVERSQRTACELALTKGITSVHEMAGGSYMGQSDLPVLIEAMGTYPIHVVPYVATLDVGEVLGLGLGQIGGDLFLDGSIGSMTAAMSTPYEGSDVTGTLYHSDDEITAWLVEASRAGLQAGVHAIGDAAVEQAIRCMEDAAMELGGEGALGAHRLGHRIEHFECVTPQQLERALSLGIIPSVQPVFDAYWGGSDGLYSQRLGERAEKMNPFSRMIAFGLEPAGGSDSTVTPLDALLGVAAAVDHKGGLGVDVEHALRMFTIWAARAAREDAHRGSIEVGKKADLAVLGADPRTLEPEGIPQIEVRETWVAGQRVFS